MEQDPTGVSDETQKKEPPGLWTGADCERCHENVMMCLYCTEREREGEREREMQMFVEADGDLPS